MKQYRFAILIVALFFGNAVLAQNTIVLDISKAKDTINKNIYGHFAEHIGKGIYGGVYVGENNKNIPNTNGIRLDIVEALKKLKIPVLRWPGGCFADEYHWRDLGTPDSVALAARELASGR